MEQQERPMSARERYEAEQKQIHDANLKAKGKDPDEEKELDELTDEVEAEMEAQEIDKSMGDVKVPNSVSMTAEQYEGRKAQIEASEALAKLKESHREHLSPAQQKKLQALVESFQAGEVEDPVLIHLIKKRLKGVAIKTELAKQGRELNVKLLNELTKVTTAAMENAGMLKDCDNDLLEYIEKES